jgi:hypothetical protein
MKELCNTVEARKEEERYGGQTFVYHDLSTHWSEPNQLYTWWKNNVERRSKYKV